MNNSSSLSLSQLYNFKKLAETQHMTRAAKELYITQPTLSLSIKALEHELGVPLFFRDGRQIKLTNTGATSTPTSPGCSASSTFHRVGARAGNGELAARSASAPSPPSSTTSFPRCCSSSGRSTATR